jgi:hypothetical protein
MKVAACMQVGVDVFTEAYGFEEKFEAVSGALAILLAAMEKGTAYTIAAMFSAIETHPFLAQAREHIAKHDETLDELASGASVVSEATRAEMDIEAKSE